jgi:two-component system sensor histidine kinase UhpB
MGLSRRTVSRHLTALQKQGLVRMQRAGGNGWLFAVDQERAAMLNARFVSMLARAGSAEAPTALPSGVEDALPLATPTAPEACLRCQNASFVLQVLDELDRSLEKARQFQLRLRQMSSLVLSAQEEERKRIARELHDDTAQALTSLLVRLRLLERAADDDEVRQGLSELRGLTADTLDGVRRLAIALRPPVLDDLGLAPALRAHVEEFSRHWPVQVTFSCGRLGWVPPDVELVLYRIVQEALSNVARHAGASRAEVKLSRRGRVLRLTVADNGSGFDVAVARGSREAGLGLFGMEERLALVGGVLTVESAAGKGTRVSAEVPLPRRPR